MKYSAGQAAKATGKSVPTITRAIRNGVIFAIKTDRGGFEINPIDLHRVFPEITPNSGKNSVVSNPLQTSTHKMSTGKAKLHSPSMHPRAVSLTQLNELPPQKYTSPHALQGKVTLLEQALAEARAERDAWRHQAERLLQALPVIDNSKSAQKGLRWPWSR